MRLWLRIALYVGGGGLVMTWAAPQDALTRYGLLLLLIVGAAYLDTWLMGAAAPRRRDADVVELASQRQASRRRHSAAGLGRERRALQTVFSSGYRQEVDELLHLLRAEGLRPMMVSHRTGEGAGQGHQYDVRLPEGEANKARPVVQFFLLKSAKQPS